MKFYRLVKEYDNMISWAYAGLEIQQNVLEDDSLDADSFLPCDGKIQDFYHISTEEVESHPENWIEVSENDLKDWNNN